MKDWWIGDMKEVLWQPPIVIVKRRVVKKRFLEKSSRTPPAPFVPPTPLQFENQNRFGRQADEIRVDLIAEEIDI